MLAGGAAEAALEADDRARLDLVSAIVLAASVGLDVALVVVLLVVVLLGAPVTGSGTGSGVSLTGLALLVLDGLLAAVVVVEGGDVVEIVVVVEIGAAVEIGGPLDVGAAELTESVVGGSLVVVGAFVAALSVDVEGVTGLVCVGVGVGGSVD